MLFIKNKILIHNVTNSSVSHTLIAPDDHAAISIAVPYVDENGVITKESQVYTVKGEIRQNGISDHSLNREFQKDGFLKTVVEKNLMI